MNGPNEMYEAYAQTSPTRRTATYRTQSLQRQTSRGFESYGGGGGSGGGGGGGNNPTNGLYGVDDGLSAYEPLRYNDGRMNAATMQQAFNGGFDMPQHAAAAAAWNNTYNQNTLAALGATGRRPGARAPARNQLPQAWMDQAPQYGYNGPQSGFAGPMNPEPQNGGGGGGGGGGEEEELIPTAIVIKNIPFAVKKEQLVDIMTRMNLPLPYAFNYHFDNGVFRGLAFANFTTAEETQAVIQHMNGKDLHGRRLRVEYKKMLPQAERDRIEREKRERRGQLEEQHRPMMGNQLQASTSMSSMTGAGGMQARTPSPSSSANPLLGLNMNDPMTLEFYGKLLVFSNDKTAPEYLDFPPHISPEERTLIHGLAHNLGLDHQSQGQGSARFVRVIRRPDGARMGGMPGSMMGMSSVDALRRGLHRAATTDFGQARDQTKFTNGKVEGNAQYLAFNEPHSSLSTSALRPAKSHADLRSYTPSPSHSTSSFPPGAGPNNRFDYVYGSGESPVTSARPANLTPTTPLPAIPDDLLANGIGNLTLNYGAHAQGSPNRGQGGLRQMVSWDRQLAQPGPIGGHRAVSSTLDDASRSRAPGSGIRPPNRAPATGARNEMANNFRNGRGGMHRTRGSDELSSPTDLEALSEQQ